MRIGLTYDLRDDYLKAGYGEEETAEFDHLDTIEAIEGALVGLGHETDLVGNARRLVERLAQGDQWDLVFNICEGLRGMAREAQVPAILDLYEIPYTFSDPLCLSVCLHKGLAKMVVRDAGVPTPRFAVVERPEDLGRIQLAYPLFLKPVAEGTSKGVGPASRVNQLRDLRRTGERLLAEFRQPVLVEEFLPGREFTTGLVGTGERSRVLGSVEVLLRPGAEPDAYSYHNKEYYDVLIEYRLVTPDDPVVAAAERTALAAWKSLGCRDAGRIDLRCDASGEPQFLEANPLPGLHPVRSDLPILCGQLGIGYEELIGAIVAGAAQRVRQAPVPAPVA